MSSRAWPRQHPAGSVGPPDPRFTPPPGPETPEIKILIDRAQAQLENHGASNSELLSAQSFMPGHEWPRFRALIRKHAQPSKTVIVSAQEPGEPLVVSGLVRNKQQTPLGGATVYFYQTSSRGWYSDKAPHISGMGGDQRHARLFGYLQTNPAGAFEFSTVRPAGYPRSTLPQHIHVEISSPDTGSRVRVTEIQFEDDPRLTAEMRQESLNQRFQVCRVIREAGGVQRVSVEFQI